MLIDIISNFINTKECIWKCVQSKIFIWIILSLMTKFGFLSINPIETVIKRQGKKTIYRKVVDLSRTFGGTVHSIDMNSLFIKYNNIFCSKDVVPRSNLTLK